MEIYDRDTIPPHEINYNKRESEVYIYCDHTVCKVRDMVTNEMLWQLVDVYSGEEQFGMFEGWFRLDCLGIYFVRA